jgi:hypothetical protein
MAGFEERIIPIEFQAQKVIPPLSTTAALSAIGAVKRANELNGDGNGLLWHGLGAVAARTTRPESVELNE